MSEKLKMAEFRFGFDSEPSNCAPTAAGTVAVTTSAPSPATGPPLVLVPARLEFPPSLSQWPVVPAGDTGLSRVLPGTDSAFVDAEVVPGRYEGGGKQWEATYDLVRWVATADLAGAAVLDLGCGAGLAGIAALRRGAASCAFQDLNDDVLRQVTQRNVAINGPTRLADCSFLAGSWEAVATAVALAHGGGDVAAGRGLAGAVDVVVSSETLYAPSSYGALLAVLAAVLRPRTGYAVFASKRYYFGVGGGTVAFAAAAAGAGWDVRTLATCDDGASMVRDLLEVRRARVAAVVASSCGS